MVKQFFIDKYRLIRVKPLSSALILIYLILAIMVLLLSFSQLVSRLGYQLNEVFNCDTHLYYAVGRGIFNGIEPYSGYYENKPPMIFLISGIAYKIFGNYKLVNILSFFSLLSCIILPLVFTIVLSIKKKIPFLLAFPTAIFVTLTSIYLTLYTQENAPEVQIENFGSSCVLLSFVLAALFDTKNAKFYSPKTIFIGVFFAFAVMFKEPYALCGFGLLFFCKTKRDFIYKILFPVLYAALVCFLLLLLTGSLVSYFTVYLNNMFSSHITAAGSPFERMKNIQVLYNSTHNFAAPMSLMLQVCFILTIANGIKTHYSENLYLNIILKIWGAIRPVVFIYISAFMVGLGGDYFWHHFVFATPFYFLLIIEATRFIFSLKCKVFKPIKKNMGTEAFSMQMIGKYAIFALLICSITVGVTGVSKVPDQTRWQNIIKQESIDVKVNADYIDEVLDTVGAESYQWIGFNGPYPYALTKHLPIGPCFVQDPDNFVSLESFFVKEFMKQLQQADVIVVVFDYSQEDIENGNYHFNLGVLNGYTSQYISENFTTAPPKAIVGENLAKPQCFKHTIFYRVGAF